MTTTITKQLEEKMENVWADMAQFNEYTSREKIVLTTAIANETQINVTSECTCFIRLSKVDKVDITELLATYANIVKTARAQGVKISYQSKIKSRLMEMKKTQSYENAYQTYDEKFNALAFLWKAKLETGLFMGVSDDVQYTNVLRPLKFEIEKMFYVNEILSVVKELKNRLLEIEQEFADGVKFVSITL